LYLKKSYLKASETFYESGCCQAVFTRFIWSAVNLDVELKNHKNTGSPDVVAIAFHRIVVGRSCTILSLHDTFITPLWQALQKLKLFPLINVTLFMDGPNTESCGAQMCKFSTYIDGLPSLIIVSTP